MKYLAPKPELTMVTRILSALTLALAFAPPVTGTATEPRVCGSTTAGATVELRPVSAAGRSPAVVAEADAAGRFCLEASVPAPWRVVVRAPGRIPVERRIDALESSGRDRGASPHRLDLPSMLLPRDRGLLLEIRDAEDRPVSGARVVARPIGGADGGWRPAVRSGRTGPDGRAALPRADGEALEISASTGESIHLVVGLARDPARRESAPLYVSARLAAPGGDRETRGPRGLLPAGRPAYGRVLDAERRPLPEAEVVLRQTGGDAEAAARTGPDGRFLVTSVPGTRFDLRASAPGFAPSELPAMSLQAGFGAADLGTLELQPGARLAGRVREAGGAPVGGVEIRYVEVSGPPTRRLRDRLLRTPAAARTDGGGEFVLADLPAGRPLHLLASRDGYLFAWLLGAEAPADEPVEIELEPAGSIAGTVAGPDGETVPGARVVLRWPGPPPGIVGLDPRRGDGTRRADTGPRGGFLFAGLEAGTIELTADADGFLPADPVEVELGPGETRTGVRLLVRPGAVVEGRAEDARGEPVVGAELRAGAATARTGPDGRYRLAGLPVGFVGLTGYHPDHRRVIEEVDVQPGVNPLDLRFEDGFVLSGRTVDAGGEPLPGVRLVVRQEGPRQRPGYGATSGGDGSFRVVVSEAGSFSLAASHPGRAPRTLSGLELGPVPLEGVEVVLSAGASIVGQIYGLELDDLATVEVEASADGLGTVPGRVDYLGRYAVDHLVPGDWRVLARTSGGRREATASVVIDEQEARVVRDLELGSGLTLSGRVRHRGEPVAGAHVSLDGRDAAVRRSVATAHDGSFRIEDLAPGDYRLDVLDPSRALSFLDELTLSADRELVLDLVSERLRGRVVADETGEPVAEAMVYVHTLVGPGGEAGSLVTVGTDASGAFALAHVAPGSYRITVRKDGFAPAARTVRVEPGVEPEPALLRLVEAGGLTVNVRFDSGEIPSLVTVSAFDAAGGRLHTDTKTVTDRGFAHFEQLPPGTWNLLVDAPGGAAEWARAEVPGALSVALAPAAPLTVRVPALLAAGGGGLLTVRSPAGEPYFEIEPGGTLRGRWPVPAGVARVEDLPAGEWALEVTAATGERFVAATATDGRTPSIVTID